MELLIAICDDNKDIRDTVESYLKWYLRRRRIEFSISMFEDGEELLNSNTIFNIIILDIEMCGIDGITVKNKLFDKQVNSRILFLTDYDIYMDEAFGKNVYAYIVKAEIEKLETYLNIIINEFLEHQVIKITGIVMDVSEIVYIEADDSYSNFHLVDKQLLIRKALHIVEDTVMPCGNFVRIHRAFIINLKHIKQLKSKYVILYNGEKLIVSRQKKAALREEYLKYIRQKITDDR